ncbi:type II toxin-antitoxin system RelE/ParE family toxin [Neorhizobium sp. NCHU2750]|uniref:type II toxin-antitoxin system RelE/ParE family toxin n=1 Tax=Neorhizobium sp. NCHU2750 TaxID=1825976 RepID=UPI000E72B643|nr:plasmid stabilization protein [Neorhizobium sp. NCHU2750]
MTYRVQLTKDARQDLRRLYAYLLDWDEHAAARALEAITGAMRMLETFPFSCRKAADGDPLLRELIAPFGASGYVILFRIDGSDTVTVAAIRHQREDDYH